MFTYPAAFVDTTVIPPQSEGGRAAPFPRVPPFEQTPGLVGALPDLVHHATRRNLNNISHEVEFPPGRLGR